MKTKLLTASALIALMSSFSTSALAAAPTLEVVNGCDASTVSDRPWEGRNCTVKFKSFACPTSTATYNNGDTIQGTGNNDWGAITWGTVTFDGQWDEIEFFGNSIHQGYDGLFALDCSRNKPDGRIHYGTRYHGMEYRDFPQSFKDYAAAVEKNDPHGHGNMHFTCKQAKKDIVCSRRF